jgi:hypothetical protein
MGYFLGEALDQPTYGPVDWANQKIKWSGSTI